MGSITGKQKRINKEANQVRRSLSSVHGEEIKALRLVAFLKKIKPKLVSAAMEHDDITLVEIADEIDELIK